MWFRKFLFTLGRRTDFINGLGGQNSSQPPFRLPRQKAEAERQTAKELEKMSARTLF